MLLERRHYDSFLVFTPSSDVILIIDTDAQHCGIQVPFFSEKTKQKINEFVEETIASINVVSLISKGNAFPIKSPQDEKNNMKTFLY